MTWDGVVTTYYKKYIKQLGVTLAQEAYIQSRVLKKTLEIISFELHRELENVIDLEDAIQRVVERLVDLGGSGGTV